MNHPGNSLSLPLVGQVAASVRTAARAIGFTNTCPILLLLLQFARYPVE